MKLAPQLERLANAETVALGPVGCAAVVPPEAEIYRALWDVAGDHVDELEWMVDHATTAGRWYAASLLARADRERGERAWGRLLGDESPFVFAPGGCTLIERTLDESARAALGDDPEALLFGAAPPTATARETDRGPGMLLVLVPAVIFAAAILWLILR